MELLLKNGYVVDSASGFEGKADILIHDSLIREVGEDISAPEAQTVDCTGLTVIPGICDMHVHFRDPGQTHKEDIITGGNAAAAGGVTAVACMPNTNPTIDNAETVHYILEKAKEAKTRVYPVGSITKGLGGVEMCDFEELHKAGCVAVSDDGRPVKNARIMAEAMVKAHYAGMKVISHCEDLDIVNGGIMNFGEVSKELGVKGIHRLSEDIITEREITLAADLEVPIHIAHVSTAQSMQNIRTAARFGTMVTIDCIITDHAPHAPEEKADFEKAPNGVVGLETSLAATLTALYHTGKISLQRIVTLMCVNPRRILSIPGGSLRPGDIADICIFDANEEWVVDPAKLHSKSKNTCFKGMTLKGRVKYTVLDGKIVYTDGID